MFARRAGWDLAPNALAERLSARRAAGLPFLDLTESNPTRCGLEAPSRALREALLHLADDPGCLAYAPDPKGDAEARRAVAAVHAEQGAALDPEAVVLTAGTSEGYAHLFRLLADPGDRVLVPKPGYPLFELLAGLEAVEVGTHPLRFGAGRWGLDLEALTAAAASPRVRAVLMVHPNNPTGSFVSEEEARALRSLCRTRGLALVSDEVFAAYRREGASPSAPRTLLPPPGAEEEGPLTFVLSGASKLLALPQLKAAWIAVAGPKTLRDEAVARLEVIADGYLSVSGLVQRALPGLLGARHGIVREVWARVVEGRRRLEAAVTGCAGIELLPCEGGWAAILRLRGAPPPDEDALVGALLDEAGVAVHPGWLFDLEPADAEGRPVAHLVLSLLPEPDRVERGAVAIADVFRAQGFASSAR